MNGLGSIEIALPGIPIFKESSFPLATIQDSDFSNDAVSVFSIEMLRDTCIEIVDLAIFNANNV